MPQASLLRQPVFSFHSNFNRLTDFHNKWPNHLHTANSVRRIPAFLWIRSRLSPEACRICRILLPLWILLYSWGQGPFSISATFVASGNEGKSLLSYSYKKPVMLIFLRHFGCVFCKEAMTDLSKIKEEIKQKNFRLAFVHMAENEIAQKYTNSTT